MKAIARCILSGQRLVTPTLMIFLLLNFLFIEEAKSYVTAYSSRRQILRAVAESNSEQISTETSMFELKEIPGKGFGAIAQRDILPGELIMAEKPLFSITTKKAWFTPSESYSEMRIEDEVEKLSATDQDLYRERIGPR